VYLKKKIGEGGGGEEGNARHGVAGATHQRVSCSMMASARPLTAKKMQSFCKFNTWGGRGGGGRKPFSYRF
jgi:hypothetical protein